MAIDVNSVYAVDLAETGGERLLEAIERNAGDAQKFLSDLALELDISSCLMGSNDEGRTVLSLSSQTVDTIERLHLSRYAYIKEAKSDKEEWNSYCKGVLEVAFDGNFTVDFADFIENNFNKPFIALYDYSNIFHTILKFIINDIERPKFIY